MYIVVNRIIIDNEFLSTSLDSLYMKFFLKYLASGTSKLSYYAIQSSEDDTESPENDNSSKILVFVKQKNDSVVPQWNVMIAIVACLR